jgi:Flp pilus assembly pilin Flp
MTRILGRLLISVVIIGAVTLVGTNLSSVFNSIATSLQSA